MSSLIDNAARTAPTAEHKQSRCWFITYNNPTELGTLRDGFPATIAQQLGVEIDKMIFQIEKGKNTNTPHVQACFTTKQKYRHITLKNKTRGINGFYIAPCIDWKSAVKYCGKSDTRIEGPFYFGCTETDILEPTQGKRSDLDRVVEVIKEGGNLSDVAVLCPTSMIKYASGIQKYFNYCTTNKRDYMTKLHILYGPTGTGKSHTAYEEATTNGGGIYMFPIPRNTNAPIWFDGYSGEHNIIIDDFYGSISLHFFLNLIDKYPFKVPIKGGFVEFLGKNVYITSNNTWTSWWGDEMNGKHKDAIERRITTIRHMTVKYTPPKPIVTLNNTNEFSDVTDLTLGDLHDYELRRSNNTNINPIPNNTMYDTVCNTVDEEAPTQTEVFEQMSPIGQLYYQKRLAAIERISEGDENDVD